MKIWLWFKEIKRELIHMVDLLRDRERESEMHSLKSKWRKSILFTLLQNAKERIHSTLNNTFVYWAQSIQNHFSYFMQETFRFFYLRLTNFFLCRHDWFAAVLSMWMLVMGEHVFGSLWILCEKEDYYIPVVSLFEIFARFFHASRLLISPLNDFTLLFLFLFWYSICEMIHTFFHWEFWRM